MQRLHSAGATSLDGTIKLLLDHFQNILENLKKKFQLNRQQ